MIDSITAVFDFIYSVLSTIITAISGITNLIYNIFGLVFDFAQILPGELYIIFNVFEVLFITILIYKLIRKG